MRQEILSTVLATWFLATACTNTIAPKETPIDASSLQSYKQAVDLIERFRHFPRAGIYQTRKPFVNPYEKFCQGLSSKELAPGATGKLTWPAYGPLGLGFSSYHQGLDIGASYGTEVWAADGGTVLYEGTIYDGNGNHIILGHGRQRLTLYAHLSEILVKVDDQVYKGDLIGKIGMTGHTTGPHLHFEIWEKCNMPVNPMNFLP